MARDSQRLQYNFIDLMKFILVFSLSLTLFAWTGLSYLPNGSWKETLLMPMVCALGLTVSLMRPRPARSAPCAVCGRKYATFSRGQESGLCPSCRLARLPGSAQRRATQRSFLIVGVLFLILGGTLVWPFADEIVARSGRNATVVLPLAALGLAVGLFVLLVVQIAAVRIIKRFRYSRPGQALAVARTCAGEMGESQPVGDATAWGFGAKPPAPELAEAMEVARKRIESIVGRPIETAPPLDVLVFDRRAAMDAFLARTVFVSGGAHDGMYIPWPRQMIVSTTYLSPERLVGVDRGFRVLFAYYWLAAATSPRLPSWIQIGIAAVVASAGDPDERARLNRKMVSALARKRAIDRATLFEPAPKVLVRLLRNQSEHADFERYQQFVNQSWSIVEFLCGADAPAGHADRFRAFLGGIVTREPLELLFERHFGHGFDALLAEWQLWVRQRGLGTHDTVPAVAAKALSGHVLPLVQDRSAPLEERIRAVREMGKGGHLLGADALVTLLRDGDRIPVEEIVWTLEAISGRALGSGVTGWTQWWRSVTQAAAEPVATVS